MSTYGWIDVRTRAVFLEFTVYNANINLYGSVIMLVEWMATGSAITRAEVKVSAEITSLFVEIRSRVVAL